MSLNISELEEFEKQIKEKGDIFSGDLTSKKSLQQKNLVFRKAFVVLDLMKSIPIMHSISLKLTDKMNIIDPRLNYVFVMAGRIHMQSLKYYLTRLEAGDHSVREATTPTFNKAVVSYKKAMALTSKTVPKKGDLPILTEFAAMSHYGAVHRELMRLSREGVAGLLREGKEAIDAAVTLDPSFVSLQSRLMYAMDELESQLN